MDFLFSSEHREIQKVLLPFFRAEMKREQIRSLLERRPREGFFSEEHKNIWKRCVELGVLGGILPESIGGLGMGLRAGVAILESSQVPIHHLPLFQTLSYALLPLSIGARSGKTGSKLKDVCTEIVERGRFASGVCLTEGEGISIEPAADGATLTGQVFPLSGGEELELIILAVERKNLLEVYAIDVAEAGGGLSIVPQPTLDLLRSYSFLHLDNVAAQLVATVEDPKAVWLLPLEQAVLAASELAGISRSTLEISIEYVKTREQFGRPVGSFQALQHKLADMHVMAEQALALTRFAAWCGDSDDPQFEEAATAAKAIASEFAPKVVEQAIQAHGGIGFTFEHDLHLYLRRAKVQSMLAGDATEHFTALAEKALGA